MERATVSVCKGKGNVRHNNREFHTKNVDQKRSMNNITYKKESLEEAYERCFGNAVKEFNAKQNRKDRMINNYMDHVRNSKNGEKLFYEVVVQVGDRSTFGYGSGNEKKAEQILADYMKDFQKRNKNLYVFNAVMHCDEATPHLHIDYIPIARGYKRGLQTRNSLDKALKQMGIDGKANKYQNSNHNWQEREKEYIKELVREHEIEIKEPSKNKLKREHLSVAQFKAANEEIEKKVRKLPKQIETAPMLTNKSRVTVDKDDLADLERRAKLSITHKKNLIELEKRAEHSLENANNYMLTKMDRADEIEKIAEKKLQEVNTLQSKNDILQKKCNDLEADLADSKHMISMLKIENSNLQNQLKELQEHVESIVKEKVELLASKTKNELAEVKQKLQSVTNLKDDLAYHLKNLTTTLAEATRASAYLYDNAELTQNDRSVLKAVRDNNVDCLKKTYGDQLQDDTFIQPVLADSIKKRINQDFHDGKSELNKKIKTHDVR